MTKHNWIVGALAACIVAFGSAGAKAQIEFLENWQFVASGQDGLPVNGLYDTSPIDAWTFVAHFQQAIVNDADGSGTISVNDEGVVNGAGFITDMINDGSGNSSLLLNQTGTPLPGLPGYEVSFDFQVDYLVTETVGNDINFTHTAPTNATGLLNIYIDNLADGSQCSVTTGLGCSDGELVGTFRIIPGEGGVINFATFDGSDDATFEAIFLADGVWFDEFGNSLACNDAIAGQECNGLPLGMTDSNLDSDPDGDGILNTGSSIFDCGLVGGVSSPLRTCGQEDGSFVLAIQVPEPAALGIFSLGLVMLGGLAGLRSRRK